MITALREIKDRLDKEASIKAALDVQMSGCVRYGVNDDFQRGYLCALYWTWQQVGYPSTAASIAAEAMVTGGIIASKGETE
ncbi:hypothetical protein [Bradyrhizobium elkanii]|jgi:hypothetical protein|uniref:hypothetical protein n=1 Tax=Bradyrhizobium elkanii TaxID=29448 RepID=UPI00272A0AC8|nr:hypothetical protein [Bradyrhizobium elkanii]WLA80332.1 hypothetical protein QNJ99_33845 [Bradyrhizobium elkanii]